MTDKVAVITGGAGGMGLATAKLMGADHHIFLSDVSQEGLDTATAELASLGIKADGVVCDTTDRDAVQALFDSAAAAGQLRAVVHAAGVSTLMGSPEKILTINSRGTVHVTEAALEHATDGFAVVLVSSLAAHLLPGVLTPTRAFPLAATDWDRFLKKTVAAAKRIPGAPKSGLAYAISKKWMIWYAEELAPAFGAKGARILTVSPGSFDTPMGQLESDNGATEIVQHAAIKRFGQPDEVATVLAYCASELPTYLTGTDILVDGGNLAGYQRKRRTKKS